MAWLLLTSLSKIYNKNQQTEEQKDWKILKSIQNSSAFKVGPKESVATEGSGNHRLGIRKMGNSLTVSWDLNNTSHPL